MTKRSKTDAGYSDNGGSGFQNCMHCTHWLGNGKCERVGLEGEIISPHGQCETDYYWRRK